MGYKKILLATDGSDPSVAAEAAAGEMAACVAGCHNGCELIVATVIPPDRPLRLNIPYRGTVPRGSLLGIPTEEMEREAEELVAEAGARIRSAYPDPRLEVRAVLLRDASPAKGILEFVANEACDFIVIGNRGHGGFGQLVLGSVSNEVLAGAPCPVMIVHA